MTQQLAWAVSQCCTQHSRVRYCTTVAICTCTTVLQSIDPLLYKWINERICNRFNDCAQSPPLSSHVPSSPPPPPSPPCHYLYKLPLSIQTRTFSSNSASSSFVNSSKATSVLLQDSSRHLVTSSSPSLVVQWDSFGEWLSICFNPALVIKTSFPWFWGEAGFDDPFVTPLHLPPLLFCMHFVADLYPSHCPLQDDDIPDSWAPR